jgi:hypothetical protein
MLKRFFSRFKRLETPLHWGPETDLDMLNRGVCPDGGSTARKDNGARIVECTDCGSAFTVAPCCKPPFMTASHVGFNRETRNAKIIS